MPDIQPTHDELIQDGLKLLDDALCHFMDLDSDHGQALADATKGVLTLGEFIFNILKK